MIILKNVNLVVFFLGIFRFSITEGFEVPDVKFEALKSGGFRVALPDIKGITKFSFTANVNEAILTGDIGKIKGESSQATDGVFLINFDDVLKVGDTINYVVFVTVGRLGYRKEDLSWVVTESDLQESYGPLGPSCRTSITTINNGNSSCIGALIIVDEFEGSAIDTSKWLIEQKIPTYESITNELNYYVNSDETRFVRDSVLFLKPVPFQTNEEVRATLDLRNGCTINDPKQCYHVHKGAFIIPPVRSGRITSKIPFKYGKVEIKARLPSGDWIVPVVQLESMEKSSDGFTPKIDIAYSRGNDHLVGTAGDDIGGRLLYGGPVFNNIEPGRSAKLQQKISTTDKPYSSDYHVYTLEWLPGRMNFYVDSQKYGSVDTGKGFSEFDKRWNAVEAPFNKECLISLGVAVGGMGEFPDNYKSGNQPRPWSYDKPSFVSPFFNARDSWLPTWNGDNAALRVEYVKVWAI